MYMWFWGAPYKIIPPFKCFRMEGSWFISNREKKKKRIMNLGEMTEKRNYGKEIYCSTNTFSVLYNLVWKYFEYPTEIEVMRKRGDIKIESRFHLLIW